jgi:hypothetical protein
MRASTPTFVAVLSRLQSQVKLRRLISPVMASAKAVAKLRSRGACRRFDDAFAPSPMMQSAPCRIATS